MASEHALPLDLYSASGVPRNLEYIRNLSLVPIMLYKKLTNTRTDKGTCSNAMDPKAKTRCINMIIDKHTAGISSLHF